MLIPLSLIDLLTFGWCLAASQKTLSILPHCSWPGEYRIDIYNQIIMENDSVLANV